MEVAGRRATVATHLSLAVGVEVAIHRDGLEPQVQSLSEPVVVVDRADQMVGQVFMEVSLLVVVALVV